jgi:hypothetical protein
MASTQTTDLVAVSGNTYPVKNQLRALGGRWNAPAKCWMVPVSHADRARALVAGAGPSHSHSGGHTYGRHCSCTMDCCSRGCRCESHCNCRGGNIYDC